MAPDTHSKDSGPEQLPHQAGVHCHSAPCVVSYGQWAVS